MKVYPSVSCSAVASLIEQATSDYNYEFIQLSEGSLGYGHCVLLAPSAPGFCSFEIIEEFKNEWSSSHRVRKFTKISKRLQTLLDSVESE